MSDILRNQTERLWPNGIGLFCLCLAAGFQILCTIQPLGFLVDVIFDRDDAFYYFVIARNVAQTGVATFDGIHLSNGVQFLWHYILVGVAHLVPDKIEFLRAVLVLCVALNVGAGILIWTLGRRLHSMMLGDIALVLWAGIMIERWNTLQGMEFSLHIVVILASLLVLLQFSRQSQVRPAYAALLGVLLTLNYWTRLDAVVFSLAIWGFAVWLIWRRAPQARILFSSLTLLTGIPAIGALAYLWASYDMAGTFLPLSGSVKQHYSAAYFEGVEPSRIVIERAGWWLKIQSLMMLGLVPEGLIRLGIGSGFNPLSEPLHMILPLVGFVLLGAGGIAVWRGNGWQSPKGRIVIAGLMLWMVAGLHIGLSIWALADFSHVSRHYYGWLLVFWIFWGGFLLASLMNTLPKSLGGGVAAVFILGAFGFYGQTGYRFIANYQPEEGNYALIRMELGEELTQDLASDAVVAAWNAGVLGYFLDRPVVNLDGLVNDKNFREILATGAPLQDYLHKAGVNYLVDHNKQDLTLAFEEKRDTDGFFRNGITWDEVDVVKQKGDIYVLEVKE